MAETNIFFNRHGLFSINPISPAIELMRRSVQSYPLALRCHGVRGNGWMARDGFPLAKTLTPLISVRSKTIFFPLR
jgi:hypothetical protein